MERALSWLPGIKRFHTWSVHIENITPQALERKKFQGLDPAYIVDVYFVDPGACVADNQFITIGVLEAHNKERFFKVVLEPHFNRILASDTFQKKDLQLIVGDTMLYVHGNNILPKRENKY